MHYKFRTEDLYKKERLPEHSAEAGKRSGRKERDGKKENRKRQWKIIAAILTAVVIIAVIAAFYLGRAERMEAETVSSRGGMTVDARATDGPGKEAPPNPLADRLRDRGYRHRPGDGGAAGQPGREH